MKKIGYLGPAGTFTQEAALKYAGECAEMLCYATVSEIMAAIEAGEINEGVVPLENSSEGPVVQTVDLLAHRYDLKIKAEIVLNVSQHLLVRPGVEYKNVKKVLSHPQALAQCRSFLEENLPRVELLETSSTAEAARLVSLSGEPWGAIGTGKAAVSNGLETARENVQDCLNNATRFVVLAGEDCPLSSGCKTSLIITAANRPGSLYSILREFALREINLTRIESRPAKKHLGEYLFFIDLEGHRLEPRVVEALAAVAGRAAEVRVIGSYPADQGARREETGRLPRPEALAELRSEIDMVDSQIIDLLGIRTRLVSRVAELKEAPDMVRDPVREREVIEKVRKLAGVKGTSAELAEKVYRLLMDYFVDMQKEKIGACNRCKKVPKTC